jgi:uncharacterized membrane-anchored protein YhcB (DUF1043 family)
VLESLIQQINPVAYLAIVIIGFFIVRTLRQIDKNQTELWNHMDDHEKRLAHIEGEHRVFTTTRGRRINDLGHIKTFDKE